MNNYPIFPFWGLTASMIPLTAAVIPAIPPPLGYVRPLRHHKKVIIILQDRHCGFRAYPFPGWRLCDMSEGRLYGSGDQ